ncbi:hypothetical protein [Amycolatopsis sp. GM8]|uniref:Rv0361 family membrane protein n=1 Tax=Amycolatopsis sp. GM8 TaxID=2896530 RepID=UPI001F2BE24C|nr:hypothetical protein [Amycolatopsis sp. GM8]
MTHPPSGPYGRPGPYGPPGGAGPYAQPAPPQQAFDPWGQAPGAFDAFGSLEGPVAKPPEKKRTGLIAGIIAAVVVVLGGGVTAIVLLSGSGDDTGKPVAAPGDPATPAGVAQLAVDAFNARDASRYAALVCTPPKQADIASLQQQWTTASDVHGTVSAAPRITGASATAQVTVTYNGSTQNTTIPMKQQGQKWCIDES